MVANAQTDGMWRRKSFQPQYEFHIAKEDLKEDIDDIMSNLNKFSEFSAAQHTRYTSQQNLAQAEQQEDNAVFNMRQNAVEGEDNRCV